jgi:redox-sensitive bicupin YhaK (pirin superfamily)
VSLIENYRHAFSLENLVKLSKAYEVPLSYFFSAMDSAARKPEGWMSPQKWEETFRGSSLTGVQEEVLNPAAQHAKVKVTLVKMETMSEVSWQQPANGTLYIYLVSGKVRIVGTEDNKPVILEESGFCDYELNRQARVQALEKACLYVTRVRE